MALVSSIRLRAALVALLAVLPCAPVVRDAQAGTPITQKYYVKEGRTRSWDIEGGKHVLVTNNGTGRVVVRCQYPNETWSETRSLLPGESYTFDAISGWFDSCEISTDDDGDPATSLEGEGTITDW